MQTFDFSLEPTLTLKEEGASLIGWEPGPKEVIVELRHNELVVGNERIIPYMPSAQAAHPETSDLEHVLPMLRGIPLVHPMLAQVLFDHRELIPLSLVDQLDIGDPLSGRSGVIFPQARIKTWTGKIALLGLFTLDGQPHFCYSLLDRLPRRRAYLLQIPA